MPQIIKLNVVPQIPTKSSEKTTYLYGIALARKAWFGVGGLLAHILTILSNFEEHLIAK